MVGTLMLGGSHRHCETVVRDVTWLGLPPPCCHVPAFQVRLDHDCIDPRGVGLPPRGHRLARADDTSASSITSVIRARNIA
jgi:hypothetical protein